jgi:ABC-type transport system involved in multi-copper enzyme maturation permease subunit
VHPGSFSRVLGDRQSAAYFADSLALTLLEAQLIFVLAITPAYSALALSEEKDRQTLSLLLTPELTDREIVWGKTVARMLLVLSAIAAGIPLLLIIVLFGSVSIESVSAGYALALGTTILTASIGAGSACRSPETRTALLRAYMLTAILVVVLPELLKLSPFDLLAYDFGFKAPYRLQLDTPSLHIGTGFGYALVQCAIGVVVLDRASRYLRKHEPTAGAITPTAYPEPPRGRPTPVALGPPSAEPRPLPPLDAAHPVLWKERHVARTKSLPVYAIPAQWLGGLITLLAAGLFIIGAWQLLSRAVLGLDPDEAHFLTQQGMERRHGSGWLLAAGVLSSGLFLVPLSIGITGCVAGERQRSTLDSLLMTLLPRRTILWSKVQAHVERWLGFGVASVAAIGCGFGVRGGVTFGLVAMAAAAAGFGFATAFAAWLSVRCPTPGRAFWVCLLPISGVIALPLVAWTFTNWSDTSRMVTALAWIAAALALSGCLVWWRAVAKLNKGE